MKTVTKANKPKNNSTIGERIKYVRTNLKISQQELADKVDKQRTEITMFETGARIPDIDTIIKIAKILNITTDYILGLSEVLEHNTTSIAINKLTGLSNEAIHVLIELNQIKEKYNLLPTINYLIEQEDINKDNDNYVIGKIHRYFTTNVNSDEMIYVTKDTIKKINDFKTMNDRLIETRKTISTGKIVNDVLLKDIQSSIENSKKEYIKDYAESGE